MNRRQSATVTCDGKRIYYTWTAAEKVRRHMTKKGRSQGDWQGKVYHCPYCQKFHVGSNV